MHGKHPHQEISLARPLKIWLQYRHDSVTKKRPVRRAFFQFFLLKKKKKRIETIIVIDNSSEDKNSGREKFKMSKQTAFARGIAKIKSGQNWKLIEYQWSHGISSGETGFEWFWAHSDLMHLLFHTKFPSSKTSSLLKEVRVKTSISSQNKKWVI